RYFPGEFLPLSILPFESADVTLRITKNIIGEADPQVTDVALGAVSAYKPFQYNLSVDTTDLISFSVIFMGFTDGMTSLNYTVQPSPRFFTQLIYGNSLGGFDVLPMTGKLSSLNEPSSEVMEMPLDPDHTGRGGNYRPFNQKAVDSLTLRTGYLTLNERLALKDMALINEVYLYRNNALR